MYNVLIIYKITISNKQLCINPLYFLLHVRTINARKKKIQNKGKKRYENHKKESQGLKKNLESYVMSFLFFYFSLYKFNKFCIFMQVREAKRKEKTFF